MVLANFVMLGCFGGALWAVSLFSFFSSHFIFRYTMFVCLEVLRNRGEERRRGEWLALFLIWMFKKLSREKREEMSSYIN